MSNATAPEPTGFSPRAGKVRGPVKWFGVRTLLTSAKEDSAATQFARFADARETQAAVSPAYVYDLSGQVSPFHLDYVADTGDGYDSTFAIARSVDGSIR